MLNLRPATIDDFRAMGETPRKTSRAIAGEYRGELVVVMGYFLQEGKAVIFSSIAPEAPQKVRGYGRHVLRCATKILREAAAVGLPVLAAADPDRPGSDRLLERLGFRQAYRETWIWDPQPSR